MSRKLKFERSITTENLMTMGEIQSTDQVLARLIADAYVADHAEVFEGRRHNAPVMGEPSPKTFGPSNCGPSNEGIPTAGETNDRIE